LSQCEHGEGQLGGGVKRPFRPFGLPLRCTPSDEEAGGLEIVKLSNALVEFSFDRRTGCLVQIRDVVDGRQYTGRSDDAQLLRVMCPSPTWQSRYADSQHAEPPEVEEKASGLELHWPKLAAPDGEVEVKASVEVDLPSNSPEATFTLELGNLSKHRLHEVRFPWVGGWTGLAGRGKDRAYCGCVPVQLHPEGRETFSYNLAGCHRRRYYAYNCQMMLPFFDISGEGSGLSYICYQRRPLLGGMVIENLDREPNGLSLSWSWVHYPFTKPGLSWRSPPIGIGVHRGDWHATADRYRAWVKKWWSSPPTPKRLRISIGFQVVQTRGFDGTPFHRFSEIPRLARDGLQFGVEDLCIWDPIAGLYLRPDEGDFWEEFDPSQSLDDLRGALAKTRRMGVNVSTLVNFRLIRGNSELYQRIGEELVRRTIFGTPGSEDWSNFSYNHANLRTEYLSRDGRVLCQRPESFRERALRIVEQTLGLGFTSLFIDQTFEATPCFSESHGHSSPDDTHEAALGWAAHASRIVRNASPESYVIGEITDVFGMAHVDVNWNWSWSSMAPEVVRYSLPETIHCWVVDHQPEVLNRAFAMGFLVAFTTGQAEKTLGAYPDFGRHVAQLSELRKRCADYVALARFRDTAGLSAGNLLAHVFEGEAGLAVVMAETNGKPGKGRVVLDTKGFDRRPGKRSMVHFHDGRAIPHENSDKDGRLELEVDLPAFGVAIWTIPCSGRCA